MSAHAEDTHLGSDKLVLMFTSAHDSRQEPFAHLMVWQKRHWGSLLLRWLCHSASIVRCASQVGWGGCRQHPALWLQHLSLLLAASEPEMTQLFYKTLMEALLFKMVVFQSWAKPTCNACHRDQWSVLWSHFAEDLKQCFIINDEKERMDFKNRQRNNKI